MISRTRFWLLYAIAWIPIAGLYVALLALTRQLPLGRALSSGLIYTVTAAVPGAGIWWISDRIRWPERRGYVGFFLAQVALAIAYSALWGALYTGSIALKIGLAVTKMVARGFIGWQMASGIWIYGLLAGIFYAIRVSRRLREQESAAARAEAQRVRAELRALRGQLDPHFLFNTLHSVSALVRSDPALAESALERFGALLRYVLDVNADARDEVALADEWAFVRNYLALEQLRLGERLRVYEDLEPDALDCMIPAFTLQPLVENSVRYAVAPRASGATVGVRAAVEGDTLVLEVRDDGNGASESAARSGSGVGLRAVRQRLETRFGDRARLDVRTEPGRGFVAAVAMPARGAGRTAPTGEYAARAAR